MRIDPLAPVHVDLDFTGEPLGVDLAAERPAPLMPAGIAVTHSVLPAPLFDRGHRSTSRGHKMGTEPRILTDRGGQ